MLLFFSVKAVRFLIFLTTDKFDRTLLPCQNSLLLYATRANYQGALWQQFRHVNINAPSQINHDWKCPMEQFSNNSIYIEQRSKVQTCEK